MEWRDALPRRSVSKAALLQPGVHQASFDEEKIVDLSYEALTKARSVEFGLRFVGSQILFLAGRYSRWGKIWPQANGHLERALALVSEDNPVVSYATEYSYLFRATGNYAEFDASEILRAESKYIPPHIFGSKENFHFHNGFFDTLDEPARHRVLTRINADLRDNEDQKARDLSIVLFHQISPFHKPWAGGADLPGKILERSLQNFVAIHDIDKIILRNVLNDKMSRNIGLIE